MPTTLSVHQKRWDEIVRDPSLQDLPYKVETNARGQLILSPHKRRHSIQQRKVEKHLAALLSGGDAYPQFPVETQDGVKQPDVVWVSDARLKEIDETGDPSPLAPEICVEVMSVANSEEEMQEKRALYRDAGAEEVWIVAEDGTVRFFGEEELEQSRLVPEFPTRIDEKKG